MMIGFYKIGFPIFIFLFGVGVYDSFQQKEIKHAVKLIHPGISPTDSVECALIEIQSKDGHLRQYYMDVESVVCGDEYCKIDIVRIFWNELGFFERLVLPEGVELEKAEGKTFTKQDYEKLNAILINRISPLQEFYKAEIVGTETSEGVDAITGATIALENSAYVKGAVWTCYTLWHWVNGGVTKIIRNITGSRHSIDELNIFLRGENEDYQLFALEQISRRKNYTPKTVESIIAAIEKTSQLLKPGLQYLESAPTPVFQSSIKKLIDTLEQEHRLKCLNAILKTNHELSQVLYDHLSFQLSAFSSYQEINLFLNIMENKDAVSSEIIQNLMPLLRNHDFLIARRAYWFLSEKPLSAEQQSKLEAFRLKNEERL